MLVNGVGKSATLNTFIQPTYAGEDGSRTRYFIPMLGNQSSSDIDMLKSVAIELN